MQTPIKFHFNNESPTNKEESRINEQSQKEDADILTFDHSDVCEVL